MNAVTEQKTFEQRMIERVKNDIGDLITTEELSKIVNRSMEECFFHKPIQKDSWGRVLTTSPSLAELMVKDLMNSEVEKLVKEYMGNNKEEITNIIKSQVEVGMAEALLKAVNSFFQSQLMNFQSDMVSRVNQVMSNR